MPKHIALVIGVSEYKFLPKLTYAQKDAELMGQFLSDTAGFNTQQGGSVCLCTHSSPEYKDYSTRPTYIDLRRILRKGFTESFLGNEDCFWFFFSGHGVRYADKDYLMPTDGDPEEPDETAIELNYVTERLTRSGAGQVVMILDACRSEGQKSSLHGFGQDIAKGVITLFSCHPKEPSYEIGDPICQSAFTYVLLQSFRQQTPENALTVLELEQYLQATVPKLNQQYQKPQQRPLIKCDMPANSNKILLPHLRVPLTIEQLKANAYQAEALGEWATAKQCWLSVLRRSAPHSHEHEEAEKGYGRVILRNQNGTDATPGSSKIDTEELRLDTVSEIKESKSHDDFLHSEKLILNRLYILYKNRSQKIFCDEVVAKELNFERSEVTDYFNYFVEKRWFVFESKTYDGYEIRLIPQGIKALEKLFQPIPDLDSVQDNLSSEKWIDYTRLRDLLKVGNWKEADQETFEVMLKAAGRVAEGRQYLTGGQVRTFPCKDLLTIDRLWTYFSHGKFGFSTQKQIWIEMGGELDSGEGQDATITIAAFQKMNDQNAWCVNGEHISYSQAIFDDSAPRGHLPYRWMLGWGDGGIRLLSSLISRLVECSR